jgi:hypothetical protein
MTINHFLAIGHFACERSIILARTVRSFTSTAEIATISINGYINGYKFIKYVVGYQIKQPQTVLSCTPKGPREH